MTEKKEEDTQGLKASLEKEHGSGNVIFAKTRFGTVAFKKPSQAEFDCFQDTSASGNRSQKLRRFALDCLVYPDQNQALEIFKKLPALPTVAADEIVEMSGSTMEFEVLGN